MAERRRPDPDALALRIPITWLTRLRTLRRSAGVWTTAVVILYWHAQTGRSTFWISSSDLFPTWGMNRHAIRRALIRLEALGLIRVDHARGMMPLVTVLQPADSIAIDTARTVRPRSANSLP